MKKATVTLPSSLGFFGRQKGTTAIVPFLLFLFCCNKKKKKATTTLLPSPVFLVFFGRQKGMAAAVPFFLFCLLQQEEEKGDSSLVAVAFFSGFFSKAEGDGSYHPFLFVFVLLQCRNPTLREV
jgi:hypothetical protein